MSKIVIFTDGHRTLERVGEPTHGGAYAKYRVHAGVDGPDLHTLEFQHDTIPNVGVVGLTNEVLLAAVADRLEMFQESPFRCLENEAALLAVRSAMNALDSRTALRKSRGVEGQHIP